MGKPTICIGENKDADQLRSNCEGDHRLCFCYTDSTIPLLSKSKISNLYISIFCDCTGWFVLDLVGTQIVGFLTLRLKYLCFRLREMLAREEQQYLAEMDQKEETTLERQAKMRERARSLKERREAERLQFVQEKYDQQFRWV